VLRPAKFVKGDETLWLENTEKYTKQTGVTVRSRARAGRPASEGRGRRQCRKGPDIVYGWYDDAHQYPEKLVDVTDIAEYLDTEVWRLVRRLPKFGMRDGKWISIPAGCGRARIVYRISA
jgi:multiple sugar transport system substrate-binding protein